jgi:hypothetical protein
MSAISGNASSYDATATINPSGPTDRPWMNSASSRDLKGSMGILWFSITILVSVNVLLLLHHLD